MLKDDKYYRACTVVKFDETAKAYNLNCDGTEYGVPPAYVRAAKPAPEPQQKTPDANQEPAGDDPPLTDSANNHRAESRGSTGCRRTDRPGRCRPLGPKHLRPYRR